MEAAVAEYTEKKVQTFAPMFDGEKLELLKRTFCKGATNDEFSLFITQCTRLNLDPFLRQIYAVKRYDDKLKIHVMTIQTGIDGFRLIAERTKHYQGQTAPQWCGQDGVWTDVWLKDENPSAARVGVHKQGFKEPMYSVALWKEYVQQYFKDGKTFLGPMWKKMGTIMLAKCAESLSLRKAFPYELGGVYTEEEMEQADYQVEAPAQIAKKETTEEEKEFKKIRAEFQKMLLTCKNESQLKIVNRQFNDKYTGTIWAQQTGVRAGETFNSMTMERLEWILKMDEHLTDFKQEIINCDSEKKWIELNKSVRNFDDQILIDLLNDKGKELGVPDAEFGDPDFNIDEEKPETV